MFDIRLLSFPFGALGPRLMPILADKRKVFCFFPFLSYVGFVPVSNHLGIFSSDWRCNFSLQFSSKNSTIEKKNKIPSKIFCHPILDETHFTVHPRFVARRKLLLSLFFLVRKLISPKDIPYYILESSSLPFYHNCSQDG